MLKEVDNFTKEFLKITEEKSIKVISHYEIDGITSASILTKTLKRLDKKFSIKILREIQSEKIDLEISRNKNEVLLIVGLNPSEKILENSTSNIFLINKNQNKINNKKVRILNQEEKTTSAELIYLISKSISKDNIDLAKIVLISYIQEDFEKEISPLNQEIFDDTKDLLLKEGPVIYPCTRPLKRTLEYSISPYIPGVTGNPSGVIDLLKKSEISSEKSLIELTPEEMSRFITAITIKMAGLKKQEEIVGKLYSIKLFGRREDLREISVIMNVCSRLGYSDIAMSYCLENEKARTKALDIYTEYKQELVSGLKTAEKIDRVNGKGFVILNAKDKIKETIIGRVFSMLSSSPNYEKGTILIGIAYNKDKIKISARIVGKSGRDIREVIEKTVTMFRTENPNTEVEFKGNQISASCRIQKEDETKFLETLKKNLEIEIIKI